MVKPWLMREKIKVEPYRHMVNEMRAAIEMLKRSNPQFLSISTFFQVGAILLLNKLYESPDAAATWVALRNVLADYELKLEAKGEEPVVRYPR